MAVSFCELHEFNRKRPRQIIANFRGVIALVFKDCMLCLLYINKMYAKIFYLTIISKRKLCLFERLK